MKKPARSLKSMKHFTNRVLKEEEQLFQSKASGTFVIPFYDPGTASSFQQVTYTVIGSDKLIGYDDQKIDCWILVHEEKGNKEIFWVSKKNREVLKLEQEINGGLYRYKIKLGFSS